MSAAADMRREFESNLTGCQMLKKKDKPNLSKEE